MNIHIIYHSNKWIVKKEYAIRALRKFKYRELAFKYACDIYDFNDDVIIVHNKDASVCFKFKNNNLI